MYENLQNVTDDVPLAYYDHLYHEQNRNARTPVTTGVLAEDNLKKVLLQIGTETGRMLHQLVNIIPNSELFAYIESVLCETPNCSDVLFTISRVNLQIVKHEVEIHYYSLRRRQLYFKWFIQKNRPKIITHPIDTHGRRRMDDPTIGEYAINNPVRQQWTEFQKEQARFL